MKTSFKLASRFLMVFLCILAIACSKDETTNPPEVADTDQDGVIDTNDDCPNEAGPASNNGCPVEPISIAQVVALGEDFEDVPQVAQETTLNEEEPFDDDFVRVDNDTITQRYICTRRAVSIEDGSDDFFLFDPNASVIYPGNLIQGKTIDDATPESIPLLRGSGVISYNIIDGNLNASEPVETISLSAVRDAQNRIIAGATGAVPASFNLSVESVQSRRELALKLGVKFQTFNAKLSGQFELNTSSQSNYVVVKLTQRFYTMDVDEPTSSDAFFDPSVTAEELAEYIQPDNPAAYISSVTYGRVFYMLFESTSSTSEMMSKLNLGYSSLGNSASGSVEYNAFNSLQGLKLQVIAYGGNAEETLEAVGNFTTNESIGEFIANLGKSGDIETGLPLSYVLKSVKRRSDIVGTNLSTEFDVVECELKGTLPPRLYADLDGLFEDGIGALLNISSGPNVLIFNKAGDRYAWFNAEAQTVFANGDEPITFSIKDENAPLGRLDIDEVGAAVDWEPNIVYLFNGDGIAFQVATVDSTKIPPNGLPTETIVVYSENPDDGTRIFQFNTVFTNNGGELLMSNGIGAAVNVGYPNTAFFERDRSVYQRFENPDGWDNRGLFPSSGWFSRPTTPSNELILFEKVGAAAKFSIGNGQGRYLFVNEAGNEIMQWFSNESEPDVFEGPWVIN